MREQTVRLLDMVDGGEMDPMMALRMCLEWMPEAEVAAMMSSNNLDEEDLGDDEGDYDD